MKHAKRLSSSILLEMPSPRPHLRSPFLFVTVAKSLASREPLNKYANESLTQPKGIPMLWTIIVILVILWLLGFIGHVGGSLIHLLLVVAVVVLIINLIQGRRGL
jgi:uncharacterized protein DUF5670